MTDNVYTPKHYTQGDHECIDEIKAMLTPDEFRGFLKGNVLKYRFRANLKNGAEDLKKAENYAHYLIHGEFIKPENNEVIKIKIPKGGIFKNDDDGTMHRDFKQTIADDTRDGNAVSYDKIKSYKFTSASGGIGWNIYNASLCFIDGSSVKFKIKLLDCVPCTIKNVLINRENWHELS